jgi:hypothetical protein
VRGTRLPQNVHSQIAFRRVLASFHPKGAVMFSRPLRTIVRISAATRNWALLRWSASSPGRKTSN